MDNPFKFTKDDVRTHLAELGYSNIQGNQLDEFCGDLERLIKYEEKKQNIGRKLDQLEQMERNLSANKENEDGWTAFMYASFNGYKSIIGNFLLYSK